MPRGHEVQMLKKLSREPLGSIPRGARNILGLSETGKSKAEGCFTDYGTFVYSRTCCRR